MQTQKNDLPKSKQTHDLEGFDFMNLKFPILLDKSSGKLAIFFNNSDDKQLIDQTPEERKINGKLLQTFDSKEECAEYWDKATLDYFGGGL